MQGRVYSFCCAAEVCRLGVLACSDVHAQGMLRKGIAYPSRHGNLKKTRTNLSTGTLEKYENCQAKLSFPFFFRGKPLGLLFRPACF